MDKTRQAKAESLHEWKSQMADFLLERAQKFGDITLHIKAADLIGMKEVIRRQVGSDYQRLAYITNDY